MQNSTSMVCTIHERILALHVFDNLTVLGYTTARNGAGGCSSDGRALQSHCRGQGFESPQLHQPATLISNTTFVGL